MYHITAIPRGWADCLWLKDAAFSKDSFSYLGTALAWWCGDFNGTPNGAGSSVVAGQVALPLGPQLPCL